MRRIHVDSWQRISRVEDVGLEWKLFGYEFAFSAVVIII